jgi:hypothetical protein
MKYLGSPITTIPKLDKSQNLGEDQAEEIIDELTKFSLEEDTKVQYCLMVSFCLSFFFFFDGTRV